MNCCHCHKTINEKPWLHLTNIVSLNEDKGQMLVDKYICGYSCYKRLYESDSLPKKLFPHIVNKEDYEGLIRPVPRIKKKEFTYLSLHIDTNDHHILIYIDINPFLISLSSFVFA